MEETVQLTSIIDIYDHILPHNEKLKRRKLPAIIEL